MFYLCIFRLLWMQIILLAFSKHFPRRLWRSAPSVVQLTLIIETIKLIQKYLSIKRSTDCQKMFCACEQHQKHLYISLYSYTVACIEFKLRFWNVLQRYSYVVLIACVQQCSASAHESRSVLKCCTINFDELLNDCVPTLGGFSAVLSPSHFSN